MPPSNAWENTKQTNQLAAKVRLPHLFGGKIRRNGRVEKPGPLKLRIRFSRDHTTHQTDEHRIPGDPGRHSCTMDGIPSRLPWSEYSRIPRRTELCGVLLLRVWRELYETHPEIDCAPRCSNYVSIFIMTLWL